MYEAFSRATGARRRDMICANNHRSGAGLSMIAGSLKSLKRNGRTASGLSGAPKLNKTTASLLINPNSRFGPPGPNLFDQFRYVVG